MAVFVAETTPINVTNVERRPRHEGAALVAKTKPFWHPVSQVQMENAARLIVAVLLACAKRIPDVFNQRDAAIVVNVRSIEVFALWRFIISSCYSNNVAKKWGTNFVRPIQADSTGLRYPRMWLRISDGMDSRLSLWNMVKF